MCGFIVDHQRVLGVQDALLGIASLGGLVKHDVAEDAVSDHFRVNQERIARDSSAGPGHLTVWNNRDHAKVGLVHVSSRDQTR